MAAGDAETADRGRTWLRDDELLGGWGMGWTSNPYSDGSFTPAEDAVRHHDRDRDRTTACWRPASTPRRPIGSAKS